MAKDMYADLEKIEARGKRKKDKSKGLFSSFGKKDELEQEVEGEQQEPISEEPQQAKPANAEPPKVEHPKPEPPKPAPKEAQPVTPAPQPPREVPARPAPQPVRAAPPKPARQDGWQPLTGARLRKAEEELLDYKKWLNQGFKSGMLTKEQCVAMVRKKEIELGIRPPE